MTAFAAEHSPATRAEIAEYKTMFPPEVVDRAIAKGRIVVIDEQKKVDGNGVNNSKI